MIGEAEQTDPSTNDVSVQKREKFLLNACEQILTKFPGPLYILGATPELVEAFITATWSLPNNDLCGYHPNLEKNGGLPQYYLGVIAPDEAVFDDTFSDYKLEMKAAEMMRNGRIELRTGNVDHIGSTVVSPEFAGNLVPMDDRFAVFTPGKDEIVTRIYDFIERGWENSRHYQLNCPSWSICCRTIRDIFGPDSEDYFQKFVGELSPELSLVDLVIIIAARQEATQSLVNEWGEELQYAASSTVSRHKAKLRDKGIITDTFRNTGEQKGNSKSLLLKDEELRDAAPSRLAAELEAKLSE